MIWYELMISWLAKCIMSNKTLRAEGDYCLCAYSLHVGASVKCSWGLEGNGCKMLSSARCHLFPYSCHSGFSGPQCDNKDYNVLYVVPGSGKLRYVLIASIIGAVQVAVICVVVLCITRWVWGPRATNGTWATKGTRATKGPRPPLR